MESFHQQESELWKEIDSLGRRLSLEIDCPVKIAADGKRLFVCHHLITFPVFALQGSEDWSWVKERHDNTGASQP